MMVFSGAGLCREYQIKENEMNKKFGYYIFGGLLIGAMFGMLWSANGNILSIVYGALAGMAIGWFAAAYAMEKEKKEKEKEKKEDK
jgi:hypothetical protein